MNSQGATTTTTQMNEFFLQTISWVGKPTIACQYDPRKMRQIIACERAANQSRLRETRLMLKLYYTDSTVLYRAEGWLF